MPEFNKLLTFAKLKDYIQTVNTQIDKQNIQNEIDEKFMKKVKRDKRAQPTFILGSKHNYSYFTDKAFRLKASQSLKPNKIKHEFRARPLVAMQKIKQVKDLRDSRDGFMEIQVVQNDVEYKPGVYESTFSNCFEQNPELSSEK